MAKVTLDLETFKALASETRLAVLHALVERRKTVTELARDLELNKATVHEHLRTLVAAGLVKRKDEGRKWVYYELTWAGDRLLNPVETTTFAVLLGLSVAAAGGGIGMLGRALGWWWKDQKSRGFANEDDLAAQREGADTALVPGAEGLEGADGTGGAAGAAMAEDPMGDGRADDAEATASDEESGGDPSQDPPPEGGPDPGGDGGDGEGPRGDPGPDGEPEGDPPEGSPEGEPEDAGPDDGGDASADSASDSSMASGDTAALEDTSRDNTGGDTEGSVTGGDGGDFVGGSDAADEASDSTGVGLPFDDGGLLAIALLVASVVLLVLAFALRRRRGGGGTAGSPPDS